MDAFSIRIMISYVYDMYVYSRFAMCEQALFCGCMGAKRGEERRTEPPRGQKNRETKSLPVLKSMGEP